MPILASLNAKNRPKSPFSIGVLFSIISEFTVLCDAIFSDRPKKREPKSALVLIRGGHGGSSETGLRALLTGSVVRVRHRTTPARGSSQRGAARALAARAFVQRPDADEPPDGSWGSGLAAREAPHAKTPRAA